MQLHNIQSNTKRKKPKRVGRGASGGTYSGRGIKGQKARAGRKLRPELRDTIKKIHKKRGYAFVSIQHKPFVVHLRALDIFPDGASVSPAILVQKKLVRAKSGRVPAVKILGDGDIKKKLIFSGLAVSKEAKQKIEKAGGEITQSVKRKA